MPEAIENQWSVSSSSQLLQATGPGWHVHGRCRASALQDGLFLRLLLFDERVHAAIQTRGGVGINLVQVVRSFERGGVAIAILKWREFCAPLGDRE